MNYLRRWIRFACGLAALAAAVWLLATAIPLPRVVELAETRTIDTTALFWSEMEGFEAYELGLGEPTLPAARFE